MRLPDVLILFACTGILFSCKSTSGLHHAGIQTDDTDKPITTGAEQMDKYIAYLKK